MLELFEAFKYKGRILWHSCNGVWPSIGVLDVHYLYDSAWNLEDCSWRKLHRQVFILSHFPCPRSLFSLHNSDSLHPCFLLGEKRKSTIRLAKGNLVDCFPIFHSVNSLQFLAFLFYAPLFDWPIQFDNVDSKSESIFESEEAPRLDLNSPRESEASIFVAYPYLFSISFIWVNFL